MQGVDRPERVALVESSPRPVMLRGRLNLAESQKCTKGCTKYSDRERWARKNGVFDGTVDEFNRIRPHRSLDCKTPEEYPRRRLTKRTAGRKHPGSRIEHAKAACNGGAGKRNGPHATKPHRRSGQKPW